MSNEPLWRAVAAAIECEDLSIAALLRGPFTAEELPSPWAIWTLVALVRYRRRHFWAADVARRLGTEPSSAAHPVTSSGHVPGMRDWEYAFNDAGVRLSHAETGERIDLDFRNNAAECIDPSSYKVYLKKLRARHPVETRLLALHPHPRTLDLAIEELYERGLLVLVEEEGQLDTYHLSDDVVEHEAALYELGTRWAEGASRPVRAALLGDWIFCDEMGAGVEGSERVIVRACADAVRDHRRAMLLHQTFAKPWSQALSGLVDLGGPDVPEVLATALDDPLHGPASQALDLIAERDDDALCPAVLKLMLRLNPRDDIREPQMWSKCASILLSRQYAVGQVLATFDLVGDYAITNAAMLAFEHAPHMAKPLFRRALRSRLAHARQEAVSALAVIEEPWAIKELTASLGAAEDWGSSAQARAALRIMGDPSGAVIRWEARNRRPSHAPAAAAAGLGRALEYGLRQWMNHWRPRVDRVRRVRLQ